MIALLENEFVEKKKWLEKSEFLDMVAVAESTPGPVAINSATYIGYKIAGFAGATMSTDNIEKVVSEEKIRQLSRSIMDVLWFSLWNKAE